MKKWFVICMASIFISSCGDSGSTKSEIGKFGISLYKCENPFIAGMKGFMNKYNTAQTVPSELYFENGEGLQSTQNSSIENFLSKRYDGIAVNIVSRSAAPLIIEKAKKANIPIVFFNREPVSEDMELWHKIYYVGAKAEESGRIQGELLGTYFKNTPEADLNGDGVLQYVMLTGEPGHQDAVLRSEHSIQALNTLGIKNEELASETAMWNRETAKEKMSDWLETYGDKIEAVLANNDDMALGAIDALKENGYFHDGKYMPVVGVDATAAAMESLKADELYATVLNDSQKQSQAVIDLLVELNHPIPNLSALPYSLTDRKYIWIPYVAVTKDNYKEFE